MSSEGSTLIAQLNDRWRLADDSTRWILQRFDEERGDWIVQAAASIMPNMENHIRKHVKDIDPAAAAIVQALPSDYRLVQLARGVYVQPPKQRVKAKPVVDMAARQRRIRRAGAAARARRVTQRAAAPAAAAPAPPAPPPAPIALFVMPKHPPYIRKLAAAFISWRSRQAARHVRELQHA